MLSPFLIFILFRMLKLIFQPNPAWDDKGFLMVDLTSCNIRPIACENISAYREIQDGRQDGHQDGHNHMIKHRA